MTTLKITTAMNPMGKLVTRITDKRSGDVFSFFVDRFGFFDTLLTHRDKSSIHSNFDDQRQLNKMISKFTNQS